MKDGAQRNIVQKNKSFLVEQSKGEQSAKA
jgi:hypothetical protein